MKPIHEILTHLKPPEYKFSVQVVEPQRELTISDIVLLQNYLDSLKVEVDICEPQYKEMINEEINRLDCFVNKKLK
jgi:hypothetical protein